MADSSAQQSVIIMFSSIKIKVHIALVILWLYNSESVLEPMPAVAVNS